MEFIKVVTNKKRYIDLLLLADEEEKMIDKYIKKGEMYILDDDGVKAECIVIDEGSGILEIKNIAVSPFYQKQGYGRKLIEFIIEKYSKDFSTIQVGTGDSPLTVPFYEKCGFKKSHIIKDFFIENYKNPIYEEGIQLIDMIYLKRNCQMTEKEKMKNKMLYNANYDKELIEERIKAKDLCYEYNQLRPSNIEEQERIIKKLFGKTKTAFSIIAPFWCDYGYNIEIGENFFANHNTVILDGGKVKFGDNVFIAPNCGFYTAGHPIDLERRNEGLEYAYPIIVGNNVWIGAGVQVMPNVTIGDNVVIGAGSVVVKDIPSNSVAVGNNVWIGAGVQVMPDVIIGDNVVIGAGSVVVKDIPSNSVAVGNPCKVIRPITEEDKKTCWDK